MFLQYVQYTVLQNIMRLKGNLERIQGLVYFNVIPEPSLVLLSVLIQSSHCVIFSAIVLHYWSPLLALEGNHLTFYSYV